ncbi:LuxR family transcriptional regulator [Sphaerisporangium sp. TRM90804]|uniref:ATP-binding protein n=1 Tax=Sphaerisporangium sp. TRM90804 TaxID=3031113 RepID=UPI002446E61F|nr:LuxR family transcriptional regulator [Sphaerisporangium sp. TRM90804]MDH2426132.1 LuxR C-terminal-related transcriptional regulator [Sphaerisporangium sp. TRM90804]
MSPAAGTPWTPILRGRDPELAALDRLLDGARQAQGAAMLLLGGPGTGKTALLDAAAHRARDFVVLRAAGVRAESRVPLSGLHALLRPVAGTLARLPRARAAVLGRALLTGTAGTGLALPAAVLDLLSAIAERGPVLVCVDDAHLLDAASRESLFFAARRLAGERVALLFAARGDHGTAIAAPGGVPARVLGPLGETASRELADDLVPGRPPEDVRAALERVAAGNPLALTELIGSLTPEQLEGTAPPPTCVPPGGRLWQAYAEQLARLPGATRHLLLLLAADHDLDTATLLRAAEPRCALTALEPAERAGVVRVVQDGYVFGEPAMRPVAYASASLARRRAAHRLLAGVLDQRHQRLRRAWHRAWALDGPAEELGDELAEAAGHAPMNGGYPGASLAFERAAELTAQGDLKAARLAAAARHASTCGHPQRARSLLSRLRSLTITAEMRGQAELLHGSLELLGGETGSAHDKFLSAAGWLLDRDRELGVRALVRAAEAGFFAGDNQRFLAIARRAAALRRPDDRAAVQLMFDYLAGLAATFSGRHAEAAVPLRRVLLLAPAVRDPAMMVWAGVASLLLGEDDQAHLLATRAVESARRRGAASVLPQLLESVIYAEIWMGRYASVAANAVEGLRLAQETGRLNTAGHHLAWLALTAAVHGDEETCRMRARAAFELADAHGLGVAAALGNWALAHLDLAAGRVTEAAGRLGGEHRHDHLVVRVMAAPTFIEAAARTGEREHALAALKVLDGWVDSTRSPDRQALAMRCHALLAGPGEAAELFGRALDLHGQGVCAFERARTQLLFGGALRRERRPGAAREHLHGALETFERLGARLWVEQARGELRAAGQAVRTHCTAEAGQLTAQQYQIARMVAEGATNREVASQLFLSPRTVEHHLRNIFARLGIRSRVELARLLS